MEINQKIKQPSKLLFAISVFGTDYIGFLTICIDSINKTHPENDIIVVWDHINVHEIYLLSLFFPKIQFIKQDVFIDFSDVRKSIPSKLLLWSNICKISKQDLICFLDADMLVYKNINEEITGNFDFLYTIKNEKFPINVGFVVVKNSYIIKTFLNEWKNETERIIADEFLLNEACNTFGAADQKALANLIYPVNIFTGGKKIFYFGEINFLAKECNLLNQTNSVPIDFGSKIFHYKGGWRSILLEQSGYTINRPIETSAEMKSFWENRYYDINEKLVEHLVINSAKKHVDILDWNNIEYQERGILHSEMLAVISVIKELNIEIVIETGRCKGQSTEILAKTLVIPIISIELIHDENAEFAEKRLSKYSNVNLLYGDVNHLLPQILKENYSKRIAILFDGPKGEDAFLIFSNSISNYDNIIAGFFHDCRKPYRKMQANARYIIHNYFDRLFFTDNAQYINLFSLIDKKCEASIHKITNDSWRPFFKGYEKIGSYGPTIAVVLPTQRDKYRQIRKSNISNVIAVEAQNSIKQKSNNYFKRLFTALKIKIKKLLQL
jgi:hypothetical protein